MKRKQLPILEADKQVIWDKLKVIFKEHGAQNTFKAMLTGIRDTKYDDLPMSDIINTLFGRERGGVCMSYLDDSDIEDIAWEVKCYGNYEFFKIDNITQDIRFEAFLKDITKNPCQLRLIS